jgi:hypothetical protein
MFKPNSFFLHFLSLGFGVMASQSVLAQAIPLNDLSAFTTPSNNWKIVGDASADITKSNVLNTKSGSGVLANIHPTGKYGSQYELVSNLKHGDIDIEMDFMLAKGSNSGIYLQGNYEVQLLDSWGKKSVKYGDLGGIYERWNDAKPEGQKGYEGYAPRVNAAKAPGLWQNIKISYQAPKFDAAGKKIANAVFLNVTVNGVVVHENLEVSGPTRGSLTAEDVAMGPLRIQGDHGSLAIKNIVINNFDKPAAKLSNLTYKTYYNGLEETADLSKLTPAQTGKADRLNWEVLRENNNYSYTYAGTLNAPTAGKYTFKLQSSGFASINIDGKKVIPLEKKSQGDMRIATVELSAGDHTFEFFGNKRDGWMKPTLGLWVAGPGFREVALHAASSAMSGGSADPILVDAPTNTNLRSFMDFKKYKEDKSQRLVHTISVGSPSNLHYTYDLEKGAVFQVWRGEFLDATPMWNSRGDGSSRPRGSVTALGTGMVLGKINANAAWEADTTGSKFRQKGYSLDESDIPTFNYLAFGTTVSDRIEAVNNQYFQRVITVANPGKDLFARLASGKSIEKISADLYAVDNKSYYIQISDKSYKPEIRSINGTQELLVPVKTGEVKYAILF